MFLDQSEKFSKFDENGIPTHDNQGKEIGVKDRKNLEKEYNGQVKLHEAWKKKSSQN